MDNLESIDKYLVSEIDGMDTIPSDQVWNTIHTKLDAAKAARKVRSRNWKIAGASALVVATASLITLATLSENKTTSNTPVVKTVATNIDQNTSVASPDKSENASNSSQVNQASEVKEQVSNKVVAVEKNIDTKQKDTKEVSNVTVNEKQEQPVKNPSTVATTVSENKKENSDKGIIMLPYFAPTYAGSNTTIQTEKTAGPPPSAALSNKADQGAETTVKTENTIYMPNAFTPNGDGLNDVFLPQTAETPSEYKLSVFDRSGNLVFYSDDIQKGWDGRINKNGLEDVKEDVYIWRIEMKTAKGEKRHLMGSVTLLK
jgi:gliding motility-associated-like protein